MKQQATGQKDPLCRNCRQPRSTKPLGPYAKPTGLCPGCKASVASVSRLKPSEKRAAHHQARATKHWQFSARQKAQKVTRYPSSSWWATSSREEFTEAQAKERDRMRASGASSENV